VKREICGPLGSKKEMVKKKKSNCRHLRNNFCALSDLPPVQCVVHRDSPRSDRRDPPLTGAAGAKPVERCRKGTGALRRRRLCPGLRRAHGSMQALDPGKAGSILCRGGDP
jgi:hypothetical protein